MSMRDDSSAEATDARDVRRAEAGDVRFTASGAIEVFDGRRWNRYAGLPADTATDNRDDPDLGLDRSPSGDE